MPQRGRIVLVMAAAAFSALACQLLTIPGLPEFPSPPASTVSTVARATHPPTATRLPLSIPPTIVIPPAAEVDPAQALLPEFASDADLFPDQTRYWIDTAIEFVSGELRATLRGQARLRYVVPEGETIVSIPLMLWPNDPQYDSVMTAGPALVNGTPVEGETDLGGIVLWLPLAEPAEPVGGEKPARTIHLSRAEIAALECGSDGLGGVSEQQPLRNRLVGRERAPLPRPAPEPSEQGEDRSPLLGERVVDRLGRAEMGRLVDVGRHAAQR